MKSTNIKFPVVSFRRIEGPFDESIARTYIAIIRVADLTSEIQGWRKINARDANPSSGTSKKIKRSFEENPEMFLYRNRGLTLLTDKASFDNKTCEVTLEMSDPTRNGLLDGGHTYRVLMDFVENTSEEERANIVGCVRMEIIEGITNLDDAISIVHARNTSAPVKEESLAELLGLFAPIKEVLAGKPYADRIAYKEYELDADGEPKDIDIKEVLSYLACFDAEVFTREKHPILAYSGKTEVIKHFTSNKDRMCKYVHLLPAILELRDEIYARLPDSYDGHFGKLTGVTYTGNKPRMIPEELSFSGKESKYRIPSSFIYPILAAFRNLVRITGDNTEWKEEPIKFYRSIEKELASRVCGQALELRNPNKLGKDSATWGRCFDLVELETLRRGLK